MVSRRPPLTKRRYATAEDAAKDYAEAAGVPLQIGATALAERLTGKGILAQDEQGWRITQMPPKRGG